MHAVWIVLAGAGLFSIFSVSESEPWSLPPKLGDLRIYNDKKTRYVEWERKEAIAFGLNQLVSAVNYLIAIAAATLGFMARMVVDPLVDPDKRGLEARILLLFWHAAIGCCLSIIFGVPSYLYFPKLPDQTYFSAYEEVGLSAALQILFFLGGAVFFVAAIMSLTLQQINQSQEVAR